MSLDPELYEESPPTLSDLVQYVIFAGLLPWQFARLVEEIFRTKSFPQNAFAWLEQDWDDESEVLIKLSVVIEEILLTFASLILAGIAGGVLGIESLLVVFLVIRTAGPLALRLGNQLRLSLLSKQDN